MRSNRPAEAARLRSACCPGASTLCLTPLGKTHAFQAPSSIDQTLERRKSRLTLAGFWECESAPKEGDVPLEAILHEVDQLNKTSTRVEALAEPHPLVSEALITIAGNVRSPATVLAVLVVAKGPKPI